MKPNAATAEPTSERDENAVVAIKVVSRPGSRVTETVTVLSKRTAERLRIHANIPRRDESAEE